MIRDDSLCHVLGREQFPTRSTSEAEEMPVSLKSYQRLTTANGLTAASTLWIREETRERGGEGEGKERGGRGEGEGREREGRGKERDEVNISIILQMHPLTSHVLPGH